VEAWIETGIIILIFLCVFVASRVEAWIETTIALLSSSKVCRLPRGGVD